MKLLVCISKVPDTTSKINFTENDTQFDSTDVNFIVNPYDEWYALVRALELKEANGGTVTVLMVGEADSEPIIRKALALGADDAVRIDCPPLDAFQVGEEIANYAQIQTYDILFFGKETIDYNGSLVPGIVAELLQLPFISYAEKLELKDDVAVVHRSISGGTEMDQTKLPLVISAQKGMAEQRIPNMRGIMQARTKPIHVVEAMGASPKTTIVKFEKPSDKKEIVYIDPENPGDLWDKLENIDKVL